MSIFEYDEEFHMGIIRAEEREEGIKEGEKRASRNSALRMLKRGKLTLEEIAEDTDLSLEEVKELAEGEKVLV